MSMNYTTKFYLRCALGVISFLLVFGLGFYYLLSGDETGPAQSANPSALRTQAGTATTQAQDQAAITPGPADASAHLPKPNRQGFTYHPAIEKAIFHLTNQERTSRGLHPLAPEVVLQSIAREHSDDMIQRGFFAHQNPDGDGPGERQSYGHRRMIGTSAENIWSGSGFALTTSQEEQEMARLIMEGWMNSPGHRANILRPQLTHLGVGVSRNGQQIRATQAFASVRAYLDQSIPLHFRQGEKLNPSARSTGGSPPVRVDLWSVSRQEQASGPAPISQPFPMDVLGTFTLRVHFPTEHTNHFAVYPGPNVEILR